jgi:gluconokinase
MGLFCYRIDRNHLLVGGALTDGGSLIEWLSQLLQLEPNHDFEACMDRTTRLINNEYEQSRTSSSRPPPSKLVVIPFLSGERSTGFRAGATGAIMGLTRDTSSEHLMKASLEGICLRLRAVLELILKTRIESYHSCGSDSNVRPCIIASGKALERNETWRQMIADCSGLDVVFDLDTIEGTSRGVARLIAAALESETKDAIQLGDEDITTVETMKPRPVMSSYYDEAARIQENFIAAMMPLWTSPS